jgi:SET domain-containing protein
MYFPPTKIYVKPVEGKGLGVFAREAIAEGETIEVCPLMSLGKTPGNKTQDPFFNYRFSWPREGAHNGNHDFVVAWGYGSLYNHCAFNPNATWLDHDDSKAFRFVAIRPIEPEEEICINYGGEGYWNDGRKDIEII